MIDKVALVYGQMNEPPGARLRVGLSGPDDGRVLPRRGPGRAPLHRQHLPLRAGGLRGVGAARPHAERGRLPADARDRDGPAPGAHHLDARPARSRRCRRSTCRRTTSPTLRRRTRSPTSTRPTVLSRAIVEKGIYPAVDPLDSSSRALQPGIVSDEHYATATRRAADPPALQGPAGHHRDPRHRRAHGRGQARRGRARRIERFLSQPNFVAEQFTGTPGRVRQARGHDQGLPGDHRRRARRARRGGLLHGRDDRGCRREGAGRPRPSPRSSARVAESHPKFDVSLVTPDGAAFDGEAEMIVVPGAAGEIGVLARHAPLVATLKAGSTRIHLDPDRDHPVRDRPRVLQGRARSGARARRRRGGRARDRRPACP